MKNFMQVVVEFLFYFIFVFVFPGFLLIMKGKSAPPPEQYFHEIQMYFMFFVVYRLSSLNIKIDRLEKRGENVS